MAWKNPDPMDFLSTLPTAEAINAFPEDGGPNFNRLIFEKSPYLLQHARNPVNWYPWGEEAFQAARERDIPVFLSIGYSTCHWCHVMEKESFEDHEVASLLNENFIAIKIDREERPDLDQIYMSVCQAVTGMGGWPLTVILTPDKMPFFAGTYFPKESRFGRTGMLELLPKLTEIWKNDRGGLLESANKIVQHLKKSYDGPVGNIRPDIFQVAFEQLLDRFDRLYGGFGPAPKFPSAHNLIFLTRYWQRTGESLALEMVEKTLSRMRLGGIYDQLGFGFHRYSTDEGWLLPHFEKMLYDQALLVLAYTEAFLATGNQSYAQISREILSYVLRNLTSPQGGFFSAEDADSEGEEGLFYLWKREEFLNLIGQEAGELFSRLFNLKEEGNYYDEARKAKTGLNILFLKNRLPELAAEIDLAGDHLENLWEELRLLLFAAREKRIHPLKDDKVLTDWNGLMIAALAKTSAALDEPAYLQAAKNAADFLWEVLRDQDGRLMKRYRDGAAGQPSHLDDYAFLIWGMIEIYQADFDPAYLQKALLLNEIMIADFWDDQSGGFYLAGKDQEDLIMRSKEIYDGALPSGNSVAANNLVRLARLTADHDLERKASQIGEAFADQVNALPQGYTHLLSALQFAEGPSFEVVISGDPDSGEVQEMVRTLQQTYTPNLVILLNPPQSVDGLIYELSPWLKDQPALGGKATAYVCRDFSCQSPTTDIKQMLSNLGA